MGRKLPASITNALDRKNLGIKKRWFTITGTDREFGLDHCSEFAISAEAALEQAIGKARGTKFTPERAEERDQ